MEEGKYSRARVSWGNVHGTPSTSSSLHKNKKTQASSVRPARLPIGARAVSWSVSSPHPVLPLTETLSLLLPSPRPTLALSHTDTPTPHHHPIFTLLPICDKLSDSSSRTVDYKAQQIIKCGQGKAEEGGREEEP
ncbi:hypothetical protein FQA47_024526 [Oryzias melastigma]|uniref:Uncharacterized protein n=1 Tax=Oryzias melastigma TaxID=30732 RepID=A0A834FJW3_ORYME|nr:hypothetical protein FQA47_024526 [Oryzias melastigma]